MRIGRALFVSVTVIGIGIQPVIAQQTPTREQEIAAAVLVLPESYRANATVVSIVDAKPITLRKGSNGMTCESIRMADNIMFRCEADSLFAVHMRQAQLRRELGKAGAPAEQKVVYDALEKEFKEGKLKLPERPLVAFNLRGPISGYDWTNNKPSADFYRWEQVIIPHATGASLSLPTERQGSMPWVMNEGTLLAHIMVEH